MKAKMTQAKVMEFVKSFDWKGLAKAYEKSQISWNARNWEKFLKTIRQTERGRIIELVKARGKGLWCVECAEEIIELIEGGDK